MTLHNLIESYIVLNQTLGKAFTASASLLRCFARSVGPDMNIAAVSLLQVNAFLMQQRPLTRTYHVRYYTLRTFFRYVRSHGYLKTIPLPAVLPKQPPPWQPYIYSREELRRLLRAVDAVKRRRDCGLEPLTLRTLLLLLYGAGLRISEAVALNYQDVDHTQSLLRVHAGKYFKSRLLPLEVALNRVLADYAERKTEPSSQLKAPFFTTRSGDRVRKAGVQEYFRLVREQAGIRRQDGGRYQPRLHDLRHTFAVHRLTSWYQQGVDVQTLLPHLCTYLGHGSLAATQVYLSMTPDLLQQASNRFENYAFAETSP